MWSIECSSTVLMKPCMRGRIREGFKRDERSTWILVDVSSSGPTVLYSNNFTFSEVLYLYIVSYGTVHQLEGNPVQNSAT